MIRLNGENFFKNLKIWKGHYAVFGSVEWPFYESKNWILTFLLMLPGKTLPQGLTITFQAEEHDSFFSQLFFQNLFAQQKVGDKTLESD